MTEDLWFELGLFLLLLLAAAFFSVAETALTAVSRVRMQRLEGEGNARARKVNQLRQKHDMLVGGLLLGKNLVKISAAALATAVLVGLYGEAAGLLYAILGVTLVMLVFSDVMPKSYAMLRSERAALALAPSAAFFVAVFAPVTRWVTALVDMVFRLFRVRRDNASADEQAEELRGAIDLLQPETAEEGSENVETKAMLRSILDLADVNVEKVMVHRKNVRMINADLPISRMVDEVLHSTFTRLPVWKESPDNIIGVIHAKRLLQEVRRVEGDMDRLDLTRVLMEPWFIPESTTLFDQLQAFRRRKEHFAIMVDEYGALMGVITLEDILEEIVGQIDDESDIAVTGARPQTDGSYIVDGKVTVRDLNRELGWHIPDEDYATIAGLLLYESQRIPSVGQVFTYFDYRFTVLKKQRNQITGVRITPPPAPAVLAAQA